MSERLERLARDDAREWKGLRLPARLRLARAVRCLIRTGQLNRRDLVQIGEISEAQAAMDLREIRARAPWAMEYDLVAKCYRVKGASNV